MADDFAERYRELLTGSYDCVDRIVLNAYYPLGHTPGGFRVWWRRWHGDIEAQATVLRWYEPLVVPGLLQTEVYARAILSARPDGNL